jgi:hypothetical protein
MRISAPGPPVEQPPQLAHGVHLAQQLLLDGDELRRGMPGGLGDEVRRAELEGLEHVGIAAAAADHQHRGGTPGHQQPQVGEAVHARHLEIEGHHVGLELERLAQRLVAVARAADHLQQRRGREHAGDHLPAEGRVVHHQHAQPPHAHASDSGGSPATARAAAAWKRPARSAPKGGRA